MSRQDLIEQFEDTGIAVLRLRPGRSVLNARGLLEGAARELGARVRTRAAEAQQYQGATHVIGEIIHTHHGDCWLCDRKVTV